MHSFVAPFCPAVSYTCGVNYIGTTLSCRRCRGCHCTNPGTRNSSKTSIMASSLTGWSSWPISTRARTCHAAGRVSPDEWAHGVIFKIAERLQVGASDAERKGRLRSLLSCPRLYMRLDTEDAIHAEANSLGHDIMGLHVLSSTRLRSLCTTFRASRRSRKKGRENLTARKTLPSSGLSTCACQPARST